MEKKVGMNVLLVFGFVFFVGISFYKSCNKGESKREILERVIDCQRGYIPNAQLSSLISDFSMPPNIIDIRRYSCNIDFEREIGGDELEREIRYWVGYVLGQRPDAKVISVKCFCPGQSLCFKTGTFSYTGEWNNDGNVSDEYGSYRLVIGW